MLVQGATGTFNKFHGVKVSFLFYIYTVLYVSLCGIGAFYNRT